MKTVFLLSVVFAFLSSVGGAVDRPNIILIIPDDQGSGDLGAAGNSVIETPNIDAMARRSASMASFYVSPVCAPTRASLMTGRHAYRTRVVDTWKGRAMMDPDEVTVAEVLRENGYRTGIFGKWHLGDCYPLRPNDQGFEESLVHAGGGLAQPSEPIENDGRYTNPILFHNGELVETKGYCTDVYFDGAIEFLNQDRDAPFFIYLAPNAPHGPVQDVPRELYEKYKAKDLSPILLGNEESADMVARVFAMVENIDQNIGRLFDALEKSGLAENTIVIFMVDNGPNTERYVGDMRGMKSDVYEGGIRSPFFVHWPARLAAGTSSDRIASSIDVMPTLLDAAGVSSEEIQNSMDGRSLLPLLEGREEDWAERYVVIQSHRGDIPERFHHFAIRDQRFKLLRSSGFGHQSAPAEAPFELYEIAADPGEQRNIIDSHAAEADRLKSAYDVWFDDVSNTRPNNFSPPRIIVGTDHEIRTVLTQQDWRESTGDGWGKDGKWLITVAEATQFEVTVNLEKADSGRAELRLGEAMWTQEVQEETKVIKLPSVEMAPGDASLTFALHGEDGTTQSAYHITLQRK